MTSLFGRLWQNTAGATRGSMALQQRTVSSMIPRTFVKVNYIRDINEARLAIMHGADAIGFVTTSVGGPRLAGSVLTDYAQLKNMVDYACETSMPPLRHANLTRSFLPRKRSRIPDTHVRTVLMTDANDTERLVQEQAVTGVNTMQLISLMSADKLMTLRQLLPTDVDILQSVHVAPEGSVIQDTPTRSRSNLTSVQREQWEQKLLQHTHLLGKSEDEMKSLLDGPKGDHIRRAVRYASHIAPVVDGLLIDSGIQTSSNPILGGTGRTHDWDVSEIVAFVLHNFSDSDISATDTTEITAHAQNPAFAETPVILGGGLTANNVGRAIRAVRPFGVDISTGIRDDRGKLNEGALATFINAVDESALSESKMNIGSTDQQKPLESMKTVSI